MKRSLGLLTLLLPTCLLAEPIPAYFSLGFRQLVSESYSHTGQAGNWRSFSRQMDTRLKDATGQTWSTLLSSSKKELARAGNKGRQAATLKICQNLHRAVKKSLKTFTLDRGFEFANSATRGERQCLLQSVLVSSLLRELKVDSGIAMVWQNDKGQVSNMGHVCTVVSLPNGDRTVVDCSDPIPFIEHKGLFLPIAGSGYRFVEPQFKRGIMISAKDLKTGKSVPSNKVQTLDLAYVRSQFSFYRGERAQGGFMGSPATSAGLASSEREFRKSLAENPQNPLSTWLLSLTLAKEGKQALAQTTKDQAKKLYQKFGWTPPSLR